MIIISNIYILYVTQLLYYSGETQNKRAAIAALKGQGPYLRFLAVLDSQNATICGLIS